MSQLSNSTPIRGCWLFGFDNDLSGYIFDITSPDSYPPEIKTFVNSKVRDAVHEYHFPYHRYFRSATPFVVEAIPDNNKEQLARFHNIVKALRDSIAQRLNMRDKVNLSSDSFPLITDELLSKEECALRNNFILAAKHVIYGLDSVENIARKFKVSQTNILIWTATYLTHGPECFFRKPRVLDDCLEDVMVSQHLALRHSIVYTCACYALMNENRFKRILHRYNLRHA